MVGNESGLLSAEPERVGGFFEYVRLEDGEDGLGGGRDVERVGGAREGRRGEVAAWKAFPQLEGHPKDARWNGYAESLSAENGLTQKSTSIFFANSNRCCRD